MAYMTIKDFLEHNCKLNGHAWIVAKDHIVKLNNFIESISQDQDDPQWVNIVFYGDREVYCNRINEIYEIKLLKLVDVTKT